MSFEFLDWVTGGHLIRLSPAPWLETKGTEAPQGEWGQTRGVIASSVLVLGMHSHA